MQKDTKSKKKKKKEAFVDDGRVVAPMNMEQIASYTSNSNVSSARTRAKEAAPMMEYEELTPKEKLAFTFGMLKAAFLVGAVFIGGIGLFILFCVFVWFR